MCNSLLWLVSIHSLRGTFVLVGEEADAKRAKREGQEDAAAAKVSKGWTVSPAELREALSSVSHAALRFDLTDMHDAAEVGSLSLHTPQNMHCLPVPQVM